MNKSSGAIQRIFYVNNLYRVSGYEPDGQECWLPYAAAKKSKASALLYIL